MKKEIITAIAAVVLGASLSACETAQTPGQSSVSASLSESQEQWAEEVLEEVMHDIYTSYAYNSIASSPCDPSRFRKAFEKAANGEEITVAYIGGSITEGYTLKPEECWAYLTHQWLCEKYPDAKINYVNAGLSGTPSTLGLIRAERDVTEPCGDPDIVFIEFAVNDDNSSVTKEAYESLVRKMLDLESAPAVSLVFMRTDTGYSCQDWQKEVGYRYFLPMVSINDALTLAINDGNMTWADYSNDGAHPNPEGSKFVAEAVEFMLERMEDTPAPAEGGLGAYDFAYDVEPVYGSGFTEMHMLDSGSITPVEMGEYKEQKILEAFPNGWMRKGGENEGIKFDLMFDDLLVVYHCNKTKRFGTAEVYVDGELKCTVKSQADDGWSNPVPQLVMRGEGEMRHSVEIKMAEGSEDDYFGLLAFGYTD